MNVRLAEGMTQLKTTVSRLQQDHHVISSAIGNSAQKTHAKIEKLTEQQRSNYESLLEQEKEKVSGWNLNCSHFGKSRKKNGAPKVILISD